MDIIVLKEVMIILSEVTFLVLKNCLLFGNYSCKLSLGRGSSSTSRRPGVWLQGHARRGAARVGGAP